jgi:hypothetical protein
MLFVSVCTAADAGRALLPRWQDKQHRHPRCVHLFLRTTLPTAATLAWLHPAWGTPLYGPSLKASLCSQALEPHTTATTARQLHSTPSNNPCHASAHSHITKWATAGGKMHWLPAAAGAIPTHCAGAAAPHPAPTMRTLRCSHAVAGFRPACTAATRRNICMWPDSPYNR